MPKISTASAPSPPHSSSSASSSYPFPCPYSNSQYPYHPPSPTPLDYEPISQYDEFKIGTQKFVYKLPDHAKQYVRSLFPIAHWLPNYNRDWFWGDLIAGLTVGVVVVPQALAYAKLASLPVQYGLYTSFIGVILYCLFATSKDVTIGPTAVISQLVAQTIAAYNVGGKHEPIAMALTMSFIAGLLQIGVGMFRLGILVDFIPAPVIAGFTTGASIQITIGQIPGLLGITGVNTNEATYKVLGAALSRLKETKLDAAFGFSALFILVTMKEGTLFLQKRGHTWAKWVGLSRNAAVILVMVLISYLINKDRTTPAVRIVGTVPKGMLAPKVPDLSIVKDAFMPAVTAMILGILEHIAVVKSFGRLNGYRADPNQELVALGLTNFLGSFFGGYPATGSFTRSAIKSQSGVRTPMAGWWTALLVILAMFVLTPLFYYVPSAVLSAIIMSAIADLVARPALVKQLWEIEFIDLFSFVLALVITFFFSIEIAIYVSVAFAVLVLLYRLARPSFAVLERTPGGYWVNTKYHKLREDSSPPPPGVLVVRLEESLTYPNSNYLADKVRDVIVARTAFGGKTGKAGDRLWCDVADEKKREKEKKRLDKKARREHAEISADGDVGDWDDQKGKVNLVPLRTLILDFSAVNGLDSTGVQMLVDLRRDVESYAGQPVDFRFANVSRKNERILIWFLKTTAKGKSVRGDVAPVVPPPVQEMQEAQKYHGAGGGEADEQGLVVKVEGGKKERKSADGRSTKPVRPSIELMNVDLESGAGVGEEGGPRVEKVDPGAGGSNGSLEEGSLRAESQELYDVMQFFHKSVDEAVWFSCQGKM
ncbi:hypothetical protein HK097_007728 [Rhizophlyctis rosea]|uniref:STAS domain-containing protein n=1 Tax=Rhizophlyctis rosea TaxID=64517 RepID=A0AAD5SCS1_9FUNG|nr:hypothetical protein HK097_007728 [Rhizophlyctis rosea]